MRMLLDTNIILDVLCDRPPFVAAAKALWTKQEAGQVQASVAAITLTTIYYVARKVLGSPAALQAVRNVLTTFDVCPVDLLVLQAALASPLPDFEDAVQDIAAELAGIPIIVTRDAAGFVGSARRIVDAATLVQELDAAQQGP